MKTLPPEYPTICFTLIYLSSAVNPIIYGVMNHKFRKEFKNLLLSLKDGVARMCPSSLRRWFKTSTANHGQQVANGSSDGLQIMSKPIKKEIFACK